jgi:transcriptional regulator with XRE-family HTH domain
MDMGILDTDKIRTLREGRGLSQEEAATLAGLSGRARWSEVESGRLVNITMETLEKMAKALGVKAKELLK